MDAPTWPWTREPTTRLRRGHLHWVEPGTGRVLDLGAMTPEDAKLLAFVVNEVGRRVKLTRVSRQALDRSRALAMRVHDRVRSLMSELERDADRP